MVFQDHLMIFEILMTHLDILRLATIIMKK